MLAKDPFQRPLLFHPGLPLNHCSVWSTEEKGWVVPKGSHAQCPPLHSLVDGFSRHSACFLVYSLASIDHGSDFYSIPLLSFPPSRLTFCSLPFSFWNHPQINCFHSSPCPRLCLGLQDLQLEAVQQPFFLYKGINWYFLGE